MAQGQIGIQGKAPCECGDEVKVRWHGLSPQPSHYVVSARCDACGRIYVPQSIEARQDYTPES